MQFFVRYLALSKETQEEMRASQSLDHPEPSTNAPSRARREPDGGEAETIQTQDGGSGGNRLKARRKSKSSQDLPSLFRSKSVQNRFEDDL